jgi:hypothetical protein
MVISVPLREVPWERPSEGIVDALRRVLKSEIHVPEEPQIVGTLEAALSARDFPLGSGFAPGVVKEDPKNRSNGA